VRFELSTVGDKQAARRLASLGERAARSRPILEDIADELIQAERRQFRSGAGWAPLAASTRARKRRQNLPGKVLHATGDLERALTRRNAPGQLLVFNRHEVRFGIKGGRSPAYYGRFHQKGRGVPKRVVVPAPTAQTRRALARIVREHLTK
jgi:phage gpG-like protein